MEKEITRIKLLIAELHNENMAILTMFLPKNKRDEIIKSYEEEFNKIWNMSFGEE